MYSCLCTVDLFASKEWFIRDYVILLMSSVCLVTKQHDATFKWKDGIFWFPFSPGSAETLVIGDVGNEVSFGFTFLVTFLPKLSKVVYVCQATGHSVVAHAVERRRCLLL